MLDINSFAHALWFVTLRRHDHWLILASFFSLHNSRIERDILKRLFKNYSRNVTVKYARFLIVTCLIVYYTEIVSADACAEQICHTSRRLFQMKKITSKWVGNLKLPALVTSQRYFAVLFSQPYCFVRSPIIRLTVAYTKTMQPYRQQETRLRLYLVIKSSIFVPTLVGSVQFGDQFCGLHACIFREGLGNDF